jgi:hypothetical protein
MRTVEFLAMILFSLYGSTALAGCGGVMRRHRTGGLVAVLVCDRDNDLALHAPRFDIGQSIRGLLKREHLVYDRPDDA